ncbi:MAG: hypothetical protein ACI4WX_11775 [Aristaeellaceae bacterium]
MDRKKLKLADVAAMECNYLTPEQVSELLDCARQSITVMAASEEGRKALGFRVIRLGSYTKIPRIPFLLYMGWQGKIKGAE